MPVLNSDQERALAALGWLFDDSQARRRQGRSTVLAIALIRHALMRPGVRVAIRDHNHPNIRQLNIQLAMVVGSLLAADPALRGSYRQELLTSATDPAVCFIAGRPDAASWLPPDWRRPGAAVVNRWARLPLPANVEDLRGDTSLWGDEPFFEPSWVAEPADRAALVPARPTRQEKPPAPRLSLWERLEED